MIGGQLVDDKAWEAIRFYLSLFFCAMVIFAVTRELLPSERVGICVGRAVSELLECKGLFLWFIKFWK